MSGDAVSREVPRFERAPSLRHLVPYQWLLFRRSVFQGGAWRGGDVVLITAAAAIKLPQFAGACARVTEKLRHDPGPEDWPAVEALLAIVLASWIFLPVVTRAIDPRGPGLSSARLWRFPLTIPRLLLLSLTGALVQPVYWLLILATGFSLAPLAASGHAVPGIVAGVLYAVACAAVSWAVWLAVAALIGRGLRWILVASVVGALAGVFVIRKMFWVIRHAGEPEMTAFVDRVTASLPGSLAVKAASNGSLPVPALLLTGLAMAAIAVSLLLLPAVLDHHAPQGNRGRRGRPRPLRLSWPASRAGFRQAVLVSKEMAYLSKTSDFWIGLVVGLASAVYITIIHEPGMWLVVAGVLAVGLNQLAAALNSFGLDSGAIDRYRVLPLSGREILVSKNRAFLLIALAQMLPILLVTAWKFGVATSAAILGAVTCSLFLTAAWGNIVSVRRPSARPFFSLESTDQSGGLIGALVTLQIWILPLMAALFSQSAGVAVVLPINWGLAGLSWFLYRRLLNWSGQAFESRAHEMKKMMAE